MAGQESETDDIAAAEHYFRFRFRREADNTTFTGEGGGNVKIAKAVKREPLRPSEAAEEDAYLTGWCDPVNPVEAGSRWA